MRHLRNRNMADEAFFHIRKLFSLPLMKNSAASIDLGKEIA